jgi:hypothetical protein
MIRAGQLSARRFGKVHVITRQALKSAEQRKTKPGPVPKPKDETMGSPDGRVVVKPRKKGKK